MTNRTNIVLACTGCNPGYHLPVFGAVADGLFDEHHLNVELLDPPAASGLDGPKRVAAGASDFCLTAVTYYLLARAEAAGEFPARFAAVIYQRSALTAVVRSSSAIAAPEDLRGRRVAWSPESDIWPGPEYAMALAERGLGAPELVRIAKPDALGALVAGDIDVLPRNANRVPALQAAGFDVRGIPLSSPTYSSGLLVGDHVPYELAQRMKVALCAALDRQRQHPEQGWPALSRRYPEADATVAQSQWLSLEPFIFGSVPTGSMDAEGWERSVSWLSTAHGLASPDPASVYREEMLSPATSALPR